MNTDTETQFVEQLKIDENVWNELIDSLSITKIKKMVFDFVCINSKKEKEILNYERENKRLTKRIQTEIIGVVKNDGEYLEKVNDLKQQYEDLEKKYKFENIKLKNENKKLKSQKLSYHSYYLEEQETSTELRNRIKKMKKEIEENEIKEKKMTKKLQYNKNVNTELRKKIKSLKPLVKFSICDVIYCEDCNNFIYECGNDYECSRCNKQCKEIYDTKFKKIVENVYGNIWG